MALAGKQIGELPPSLLLIYAQLLEQASEPLPAVEDTAFLRREIEGKPYWFRRVQIGSTRMEISLGRETEKLVAEIEKAKSHMKKAGPEIKSRENLAGMLIAGGSNSVDPLSGRVLTLLEGAGVFAAGGVLVGSHAFNVYGNMLGYKFPLETARTADIDLSISIGVTKETTDLRTVIMESGLDFFEVPALDRNAASTSYKIRGKELKVDLLTPLSGPETSKPVYIPALKTYATPLRFLDYLIKDPVKAVVVVGRGVLVNVPQPARYAVHKLALSQKRPSSMEVKSIKDLNQAACLLEILATNRPADLHPALIDIREGRSRKFEKQLLAGFRQACNKGLLSDDVINYFNRTWEDVSQL
jgi:hypothetical protein